MAEVQAEDPSSAAASAQMNGPSSDGGSSRTRTKNAKKGPPEARKEGEEEEIITALSTQALETKLRYLRDQSNRHSQALTQKLATSQSGQNLLHIGSSLSTLPPDLHSLLTQLHPVLSAAETSEKQHLQFLQNLVKQGNEIRSELRRVEHAAQCAVLYEDLLAGERDLKQDEKQRKRNVLQVVSSEETLNLDEDSFDELDHVASLERAAHTALSLVQDLHRSSEQVSALTSKLATSAQDQQNKLPSLRSPLENDTERAQFIMKLAPRIRRLESDAITCLSARLEVVLKRIQQGKATDDSPISNNQTIDSAANEELLLMIGHCMRGLALLGKGQDAENIFARVAIMPLIRSKVGMGRLDEGGSRGECAGLPSLLQEMSTAIANNLGAVLRLAENMFVGQGKMEVDLVTAGVWVPIATALMADAGIKMAIFSPGIASILQSNYLALDTFLSELAGRLLTDTPNTENMNTSTSELSDLYFNPIISKDGIQKAQYRIFSHPKTAEFSKRWNLPIYYQLRFGDACTRLNTAFDRTQKEGWLAEVYGGQDMDYDRIKRQSGFELSLFVEIYDVLSSFWRPDVFLRPLTHRFIRGAVQIIGRTVSFVGEGLDGQIQFGEEKEPELPKAENGSENGDFTLDELDKPMAASRDPYFWHENLMDVAAVSWEMNILESKLTHEFIESACNAAVGQGSKAEREEISSLVKEVLSEVSCQIGPLVKKAWNEVIVNILTSKCCGPLAAVKGVAATYRMTNRPPPTQPSPFVPTILRPLKEFNSEFRHKTPLQMGVGWKLSVVNTIAQRYSSAVEELIATVQRTEVALKNRKARKMASGGMSDGDKVKLQLYLDYKEFSRNVQEVGIDPSTVEGISKLEKLTSEAKQRAQNGK